MYHSSKSIQIFILTLYLGLDELVDFICDISLNNALSNSRLIVQKQVETDSASSVHKLKSDLIKVTKLIFSIFLTLFPLSKCHLGNPMPFLLFEAWLLL